MYPCSLETVSGQFYHPRVSAVWPGPHALTTRVKRCEPANTGFRRCGPGHTNQGCLSSRVACVARIVCNRAAETVSGRFYPPKSIKCVAWATRIDNEGHNVWHWPHGFSTVWPVPHIGRLFVKWCGWRSISSKFGGSPRAQSHMITVDLDLSDVGDPWRTGRDAACRSDPTFTRASPGLAVATGNSLK